MITAILAFLVGCISTLAVVAILAGVRVRGMCDVLQEYAEDAWQYAAQLGLEDCVHADWRSVLAKLQAARNDQQYQRGEG